MANEQRRSHNNSRSNSRSNMPPYTKPSSFIRQRPSPTRSKQIHQQLPWLGTDATSFGSTSSLSSDEEEPIVQEVDYLGKTGHPKAQRRRQLNWSKTARKQIRAAGLVVVTLVMGLTTLSILAEHNRSDSSDSRRRQLLSKVMTKHNPVKRINLPDEIRNALQREFMKLRVNTSDLADLEQFILDSKSIFSRFITHDIRQSLDELTSLPSPTSAIIFSNLPVDVYVPPTPIDGSVSLHKPTFVAEAVLMAMGAFAGTEVIGYSSETQYSNPWIHEGFARKSRGSALTSESSLSFHQDMSYHPEAPDLLGLVCVRTGHDERLNTLLLDVRELLDLVSPEATDILAQPRFQIHTSDWVDNSYQVDRSTKRPLLKDGHDLSLPVHWKNMVALDDRAQEALDELKSVIEESAPVHSVHFQRGDLLLFHNRQTVHGRTPYSDLRFDGGDRVLYRSYFRQAFANEQEAKTRMI